VSRSSMLAAFALAILGGCRRATPSIEFTEVPVVGQGGAASTGRISGRVAGAKGGYRIVVYARAGTWWIQPFASKPFTAVQKDSTWSAMTHLGTEYAALVVEPGYAPPKVADVLPMKGGGVAAVATVPGKSAPAAIPPTVPLHFSGYDWDVYQVPRDMFGSMHANSPSNATTDNNGFLHLRLCREGSEWVGTDIKLNRSLGYGSYFFVVRDMPRFEPDPVFGITTYDPLDAGQNHREVDINIGQFGNPRAKNAQFVIQPAVPANMYRFDSPPGRVIYSFRWEPGRMSFSTEQSGRVVAEHVFTSGVPSPGGEAIHMNLYTFGNSRIPQHHDVEVVIEKFTYLP
jgi:hypothetical protein